jgi:hypothetical protein
LIRAGVHRFAPPLTARSRFHIDGLKQDGLPVPKPTSIADYVEA